MGNPIYHSIKININGIFKGIYIFVNLIMQGIEKCKKWKKYQLYLENVYYFKYNKWNHAFKWNIVIIQNI